MPARLSFDKDGHLEIAHFDTPEEAAQFYRVVLGSGAHSARKIMVGAEKVNDKGLHPKAHRLLQELINHPDGVTSEVLAQRLEVERKGLGAIVVSVNKWGERQELRKREILRNDRVRENGRLVRRMKLAPSFRKRLEEGKIKLE